MLVTDEQFGSIFSELQKVRISSFYLSDVIVN